MPSRIAQKYLPAATSRSAEQAKGTSTTVVPRKRGNGTVTVDGSQSGIGATVGGVVGAIGGYAGSGVQREGQVLGVLAGVAGAAAGNAIERFSTKEEAFEILVQLKGGERRAIVQAKGTEILVAGDPVIIVTTGNKVRVTKAPK